MTETIEVLDKGYVRLVDVMGTDLSVTNAARVSFDKESKQFNAKDDRLLTFLARENHTAPFRHATLSFEIYAPLMVARQWWKYVVGSTHQDVMVAWNESSRRYVTEKEEFYMPTEWRSSPDNKKQGSGAPVDEKVAQMFSEALEELTITSTNLYNKAMESGICAEQARLFLPAYGMYVRWRWTASLQGVLHFLNQRLAHDAQKEIQAYAAAVADLSRPKFPSTFKAFNL